MDGELARVWYGAGDFGEGGRERNSVARGVGV